MLMGAFAPAPAPKDDGRPSSASAVNPAVPVKTENLPVNELAVLSRVTVARPLLPTTMTFPAPTMVADAVNVPSEFAPRVRSLPDAVVMPLAATRASVLEAAPRMVADAPSVMLLKVVVPAFARMRAPALLMPVPLMFSVFDDCERPATPMESAPPDRTVTPFVAPTGPRPRRFVTDSVPVVTVVAPPVKMLDPPSVSVVVLLPSFVMEPLMRLPLRVRLESVNRVRAPPARSNAPLKVSAPVPAVPKTVDP